MRQVALPPDRTQDQRRRALDRGNEIRSYRAELKRKVARGERTVLDVLAEPEPEVHTMKMWDLLLAVPKVGRVKADKTLRQAKVSPSKTLGGLTERQRRELQAVLPRPALPSRS